MLAYNKKSKYATMKETFFYLQNSKNAFGKPVEGLDLNVNRNYRIPNPLLIDYGRS
jgi:hypothetical protein